MIIYKTTNLINEKIYIGQDKNNNPEYLGSGLLLSQSISKYGKQYFSKSVIEECNSKEELNERETYWIRYYNSCNREIGYNISNGAWGGDTFTNNPNKEIVRQNVINALNNGGKEKISNTLKELWQNDDYKNMQIESRSKINRKELNKKISEKTKEKMQDPEIRKKCSIGGLNKSDEGRKRLSEAAKNRIWTEKSRKKLSQSKIGNKNTLGRKASEEEKLKRKELYKNNKKECPYCHKLIDIRNYAQFHGEKCKMSGNKNIGKPWNKK